MDISMIDMALVAAGNIFEPLRLMYLAAGVLIGLALGVIPGLGGIVGMALLLPFTFTMDAYSAFAFLLGMGSVTTTSDTIPAVLFGVPGTTGSAATILDGHPMAKKGQAGRAFGAAYTASMIGGLFGALLLGVSIPVLRPLLKTIGAPELLSFSILGLSMVAVLSGRAPLRGLAMAAFGIMIAMVGGDPQVGDLRWDWDFDSLYLYDGFKLVPITLGLFALPELADMAIARRSIAGDSNVDSRSGQWEGIKDTFRHKFLVLRVAFLGSTLGAIPGIGSAVIDWIAYGHAARTEKGAAETFGSGDVRGVLASEGSNNAKEGGALVPTIAFGVPGSASMAILLGAFTTQGLIAGPDMLSQNLAITYGMVWSVALANILGAGICFMFSNQIARIALIRQPIIMPLILTVIFVGAFQAQRQWGDFYTLVGFGLLGWFMKRCEWPRPPLILGVVLGGIVERYLFISYNRWEFDWLFNWSEFPLVFIIFVLAIVGLLRPLLREIRSIRGRGLLNNFYLPRFNGTTVFYLCFLVLIYTLNQEAANWEAWQTRMVPEIVGWFAFGVALLSLFNHTFRRESSGGLADEAKGNIAKSLHMDLKAEDQALPRRVMITRALIYLTWLIGFLVGVKMIGVLPTVFFFVILYMRREGRERWSLVLLVTCGITGFSWFLFDQLLSMVWPQTLMGEWFPILHEIIPSM